MDAFVALLESYEQAALGADRAGVLRRIHEAYRAPRAVLVGDMSGFSRRVAQEGIVPFISLIYRMRRLCTPCIAACGGYLFKAEADNLFGAFERADQAVRAAVALQRLLDEDARRRPADERIQLSIGVAFGDVLAIGEEEVWGHAVNVASKLGEDIAAAGEVLIDESTAEAARQAGLPLRPDEVSVSGVAIRLYHLDWRAGS